MDLLSFLVTNLLAILSVFLGLWFIAQRTQDPSFVDAFWAFGITLSALISFAAGSAPLEQRLLMTGLCLVWGLRLGLHLFWRWRHEGVDRRYANLIQSVTNNRGWSFARTTAVFIFLPQAVLLWMTALPVQLGQFAPQESVALLKWTGLGFALFGLTFEALADEQLRRFKADQNNTGRVMDTGLWAWSRHPNYFGEAIFWWGMYLIAAQTWLGAASIAGPAFLTFTLMRWSGVPLLEKDITKHRPAYAQYASQVSAFIPNRPSQNPGTTSGHLPDSGWALFL